jgi:para-nitrobenzyl esterase
MGVASTLSDGEKDGVAYAKSKGVSTIAELRAMPAAEIVAVDMTIKPWPRFGNNIDGYSQISDRMNVFAEGKPNDTPFMTGMNADEVRYMGEKGTDFEKLYPSASKENAAAVEKEAGQEQSRLNAYLWLEYRAKTSKTNGYVYYFDQAIPWPAHPEFGAFHTGEIPYAFNNLKTLNRPWTAVDIKVADEMSSYWVNFAKSGNPNGQDLPKWNAYTSEKAEVMRIGANTGMMPAASSKEKLDFLKKQILKK